MVYSKLSLTGKPEQQRFTIQSGVLTSISSRQRSAISSHQLPNEQTLDPQSAARQTRLCPSQPHNGLHLAMFSHNTTFNKKAMLSQR